MHSHLRELEVNIMAGIPASWIVTYEESRTLSMLADFRDEMAYSVVTWDLLNFGKVLHANSKTRIKADDLAQIGSPVAAIKWLTQLKESGVIFIIKDAHRFMKSPDVIRAIKDFIDAELPLVHLICMSHTNAIPEELEKDMLLAHIALPSQSDLAAIAEHMIRENDIDAAADKDHIKAVQGLTAQEAGNAFALTLAKLGDKLSREELETFKLEAVKKSGMMEIFPAVAESELGGLDALKTYMKLRASGFDDDNLPTPTGILLMGLPGGGKSLSAKVIASILKMPLIKLDIASLKSKYVGESESKMGQALNLIDAVSPAVVWLDK